MDKLNQLGKLINKYCSDDWVYLLNEKVTERKYKAKSLIFQEGDKMNEISYINQGNVKIFGTYGKGPERVYRFATDGEIIGHRGLGESYTYPVSAIALTDTNITDIPLPLFKSLLKANSLFSYHFMLFFSEELRRSERQIKNLMSLELRQRVAQALLVNIDTFGFDKKDPKKLAFTISRKDIAYLSGSVYESVIRTLSEFQKDGIIEILNKEIRILDHDRLVSIFK